MVQTHSEGAVPGPQPGEVKLRKLKVTLGNAYVRLTARDRQKVMRTLEQFTYGKKSSASHWYFWSKDEMKSCYLQLKPISQKMANDLRRWALELLKVGHNNRLAAKSLMDELSCRRSIEEP
jgi:hypothetical protein